MTNLSMTLVQVIQTYKAMGKSGIVIEVKVNDYTDNHEYVANIKLTESYMNTLTDYYTRKEAIIVSIVDFVDEKRLTLIDGD